ncbi:MAG: 50S ribosomal protein L6 [Thaumarchaeota archaeon]|nr:50S ribosomal protein L6 [Nitrososphaerota archaeon]
MATSTKHTQPKELIREIEIPNGVTASMKQGVFEIKGPLGTAKKDFNLVRATIIVEGKKVKVKPFGRKKEDKAVLGTASSIIASLIHGVMKGFTYKVKVVFAHFPITVKVKGNEIHVENFYGERSPRVAQIVGDCKASVQGDDVIIQGTNVEDVGHTAANIEQATKVRRKDQRVFLDGLYLYEKVRN